MISLLKRNFLLLLLALTSFKMHAAEVVYAKTPVWVTPAKTPSAKSIKIRDIDLGYFYLLVDEQVDVASEAYYSHYVLSITNEVGVQEGSHIEINYDPSFQKLTIHDVHINRNGKTVDKLKLNEIKLLQREEDLKSRVYDGSYTAFINLSDVRVGDQIEYSYSIKGRNPIYNGYFLDEFSVTFTSPVASIFHKIISPVQKKLQYKNHQTDIKPKVYNTHESTIYEWETECITPIVIEENTPKWYNPLGWIEVSEFGSWEDIVNWALPLYKVNKPLSDELLAWVNQYRNMPDEKKILTVLQFVQQDIRYMGFEVGVNSHKPRDPSVVFNQRFGDCKDKSLLMCTLLNKLGIQAYPNLVHTELGKNISTYLPNPWHFNHVTVCVELNGVRYFLDPTESYQKGKLKFIQYHNAGYTLILKPQEKNLLPITTNHIAKREVFETFVVHHQDSSVTLRVITYYYGIEADWIRYSFSSQSLASIEKSYLDFYKESYGDVTMVGAVEFTDDTAENMIKVFEEYLLNDIITTEKSGRKQIQVSANLVFQSMRYENNKRRKQPYSLTYPLEIVQTIEVKLPFAIPVQQEQNEVNNDCFQYSYDISNDGNNSIVMLKYRYKTLKDVVEVDQLKSYIEQTEEILNMNAYYLYWNADGSALPANTPFQTLRSVNWITLITLVISIIGCLLLALYIYRLDVEPKHEAQFALSIAGTLLFIKIALPIGIVINVFSLFSQGYFYRDAWDALGDVTNPLYHPMWHPLIIMEIVQFVALIIGASLAYILFLKRRSSYPLVHICILAISFAFCLFEYILMQNMPEVENTRDQALQAAIRSFVACAIWIPFLLTSWRVRETFAFTFNPERIKKLNILPPEETKESESENI